MARSTSTSTRPILPAEDRLRHRLHRRRASSCATSTCPPTARPASDVVAIASRTPEHARAAAEQNGVADGLRHVAGAARRPERVEIVDIAYPPDQQLEIVREAVQATAREGHPRPEADGLHARGGDRDRQGLPTRPARSSRVNHNMRYDQSMRALKTLLDRRRARATPIVAADRHERPAALAGVHQRLRADRDPQHVDPPPRRVPLPVRRPGADPRLRAQRPEPRLPARRRDGLLHPRVRGRAARDRRSTTASRGPTTASSGASRAPRASRRARSAGPTTRPGARRRSTGRPALRWTASWERPRWEERWFPQAFKGTMGQLMRAIQEDAEPEISRPRRRSARWRSSRPPTARSSEGSAVELGEVLDEFGLA